MSIAWGKKNHHMNKCLLIQAANEFVYPQFVPREIWLEILSRLQMRDLIICGPVCKSWNSIVKQLRMKTVRVPLCGLLLIPPTRSKSPILHYISTRNKEIIRMEISCLDNLTVHSGSDVDGGLLGNLSLDFQILYTEACPSRSFFTIHGGLVLRVDNSGCYLVSNPATKQVYVLGKPPIWQNFGAGEKTGMVFRLSSSPIARLCNFTVVRLCRKQRVIELYNSRNHEWKTSKLELDERLMKATWCFKNYASLRKDGHRFLFFLTSIELGVAVKIPSASVSRMSSYGFRLPEVVIGGYKHARLGECGGEFLHLAYCNVLGIWIWKHDGGSSTVDAWIPLLEISNVRQLCKPVAQEHLAKSVASGHSVVPLAFHPDFAVLFLRINSSVFAYDSDNDTIEKIAEIGDHVSKKSTVVLPYKPWFDSFQVLRRRAKQYWSESDERKGFISWDAQMLEILTSIWDEQLNQGNKVSEDWEPQAYRKIIDEVKSKLGLVITVNHVKFIIKRWKQHYDFVMDIWTTTNFKWDDEKKMVMITKEELSYLGGLL